MRLVGAKFLEVLARAGFTVAASFMLPLAEAGQFGIVVTLIGLFAFAFGWERYIDIQRRFVGAEPHQFDRAVLHAFQLWGFNYLLLMPFFLLVAGSWADLGPWPLLLCALVVIGEHVANQAYNLAVVQPRYVRLVAMVAAKNVVMLLLTGYVLLFAPRFARLDLILEAWALVSLVATASILAVWILGMDRRPDAAPFSLGDRIFRQHRASLTHFGIGLLGVLMLQFDRLVVGGLLPLEEVGIYFRHILAVSFAYQFFNIASYNRKVPEILAQARSPSHGLSSARRIVRVELAKVGAVVVAGFALAWLFDVLTDGVWTARFSLRLDLAALLILGALFRVAADYGALMLNSRMREKLLLRQQLVSFGTGALLLIGLTYTFGMFGTASATIVGSVLYFVLNTRALHHLPEMMTDDSST